MVPTWPQIHAKCSIAAGLSDREQGKAENMVLQPRNTNCHRNEALNTVPNTSFYPARLDRDRRYQETGMSVYSIEIFGKISSCCSNQFADYLYRYDLHCTDIS